MFLDVYNGFLRLMPYGFTASINGLFIEAVVIDEEAVEYLRLKPSPINGFFTGYHGLFWGRSLTAHFCRLLRLFQRLKPSFFIRLICGLAVRLNGLIDGLFIGLFLKPLLSTRKP